MSANVLVLTDKEAELKHRKRVASGKRKKVRNISTKKKLKKNSTGFFFFCSSERGERIFIVLKFVVFFSALAN